LPANVQLDYWNESEMNIRFYIERVILDGLTIGVSESTLLKQAMETELAQLFLQGQISPELAAGGAYCALRPVHISMPNLNDAGHTGHALAHAVYRRVGGASGLGERNESAGRQP
jgi:hypothetical protein